MKKIKIKPIIIFGILFFTLYLTLILNNSYGEKQPKPNNCGELQYAQCYDFADQKACLAISDPEYTGNCND